MQPSFNERTFKLKPVIAQTLLYKVLFTGFRDRLIWVYCVVDYSGRGSGTSQLSPSSFVLAAGVLSGFRLSSVGSSLKFPEM